MSVLDNITEFLPPTSTKLKNYILAGPGISTPLSVIYMEVTDDPLGGQPFMLAFSAPEEYNFNTAQDPKRKKVLAFVYANWVLQTVQRATVAFLQSNAPPTMLTRDTSMTLLVTEPPNDTPRLYSEPFPDENRAAAAAEGFAMDPCPVVGFNTLCEVIRDCNKNQEPEKIKNGQQKVKQLGRWDKLLVAAGLGVVALLKWGIGALIAVWAFTNIACAINICACTCGGLGQPSQGIVEGTIQDIPDCANSPCCPCNKGTCKPGSAGVAGKIYQYRGCNCDVVCVDTCRGDLCTVSKGRPAPSETAGAVIGVIAAIAIAAVAIGGVYVLATRERKKQPPASTMPVTGQPPPLPPPGPAPPPSLATRAGQGAGRFVSGTRRGISEFAAGARQEVRR